ncbi:unnamed protein product [Nesidiocoris tenuis]|uniref:Uncharacterized protein n=1 Tax=Nesidiocoris tenuis TaxID=355587 RepID=A0A6H5GI19_9HEMI|nr:unnamed protein product [Nesidiocoris tenuis]
MRSYQQVATDVNEALAIDEIISAWENLNSRFACGMRTEPRLTHQFPFHMSRRTRKRILFGGYVHRGRPPPATTNTSILLEHEKRKKKLPAQIRAKFRKPSDGPALRVLSIKSERRRTRKHGSPRALRSPDADCVQTLSRAIKIFINSRRPAIREVILNLIWKSYGSQSKSPYRLLSAQCQQYSMLRYQCPCWYQLMKRVFSCWDDGRDCSVTEHRDPLRINDGHIFSVIIKQDRIMFFKNLSFGLVKISMSTGIRGPSKSLEGRSNCTDAPMTVAMTCVQGRNRVKSAWEEGRFEKSKLQFALMALSFRKSPSPRARGIKMRKTLRTRRSCAIFSPGGQEGLIRSRTTPPGRRPSARPRIVVQPRPPCLAPARTNSDLKTRRYFNILTNFLSYPKHVFGNGQFQLAKTKTPGPARIVSNDGFQTVPDAARGTKDLQPPMGNRRVALFRSINPPHPHHRVQTKLINDFLRHLKTYAGLVLLEDRRIANNGSPVLQPDLWCAMVRCWKLALQIREHHSILKNSYIVYRKITLIHPLSVLGYFYCTTGDRYEETLADIANSRSSSPFFTAPLAIECPRIDIDQNRTDSVYRHCMELC